MASFVEVGGHAGDEGNFEALYETYKHDVQRLASYLLKNASDAEDAAQTVFMNVLRALRQGVTPADPRAWLLAITRNVCFSRGRAAAARPDYVELDHETPSQPSDDEAPSADEIVGALTRMRPNQRTALILRDFRGVSRSEISDLMSLSSVSVEALLTRARSSFREELEAGDQPFVCEETRALVEQQLDGEITVADRHSLRAHLRHCTSCSTLARAVRSSRGKLAGLIFWPTDVVSRLLSAFSQAPSVAHVAAAITSTAAVATVAIPVAITTAPTAAHVEVRTAPAAAVALHTVTPRVTRAATPAVSVARTASRPVVHHASRTHKATRVAKHAAHHSAHHAATRHGAPKHVAAAPTVVTHGPATHVSPTESGGAVETPAAQAVVHPVVVQTVQPRVSQPVTTPRSVSPALRPAPRPHSKPAAKPGRKSSRRRGSEHRSSGPPDRMPASSPPADGLAPADGGATNGAGPGFSPGAVVAPAVVPVASSSSNGGDSGDSGDNGKGHKHHK